MTSELQTAVVSEFCLRAPCGRTDIKSGSLETEAIQKFLSVCLKQYFSCSQDETNEASFSNVSPEILEVCWNSLLHFSICNVNKCMLKYTASMLEIVGNLEQK